MPENFISYYSVLTLPTASAWHKITWYGLIILQLDDNVAIQFCLLLIGESYGSVKFRCKVSFATMTIYIVIVFNRLRQEPGTVWCLNRSCIIMLHHVKFSSLILKGYASLSGLHIGGCVLYNNHIIYYDK